MSMVSESEHNERMVDLEFLLNVDFPWTSMRIEADCLDNVGIEIVTNLLSRVVRLELSYFDPRGTEHSNVPDTCRFLVAAQSLQELVIDECYFEMTEVDRNMFMSVQLRTIVEHLNVLHIKSEESRNDNFGHGLTLTKLETVKALVSIPKHLRSFSFHYELAEAEFVKSLLTSLEKHVNTLTSLDLHNWAWNTDDVLDLVCPNLKELNIMAHGKYLARVCKFIMKQGPLLELDINLLSGRTLSPKPLVDTLILRGSQLITFSLSWYLDPRMGSLVPGPLLDFSWLQTMSKLKSFSIRQFHANYYGSDTHAPVYHILANLPAGVKTINYFGELYFLAEEAEITRLMIANLGRFHDIRVLNLLRCVTELNDDILLFISSNFPQLRELGISFCSKVTSVGFNAIGALKALQKLKVYGCSGIRRRDRIMLSFSFPELKVILMDDRGNANDDYYKRLQRRNRMLGLIVIGEYGFDVNPRFQKTFSKDCPC